MLLGYARRDNFPHISSELRGIPVATLILSPTILVSWAVLIAETATLGNVKPPRKRGYERNEPHCRPRCCGRIASMSFSIPKAEPQPSPASKRGEYSRAMLTESRFCGLLGAKFRVTQPFSRRKRGERSRHGAASITACRSLPSPVYAILGGSAASATPAHTRDNTRAVRCSRFMGSTLISGKRLFRFWLLINTSRVPVSITRHCHPASCRSGTARRAGPPC